MQVIQPLLLCAFFIALLIYLRFFRTLLRDRLIAVLLFVVACTAVLKPSFTQKIADLVGVGRGADLTFYLFAVAFVFFAVLTFSKLTRTTRDITELVRRLALLEATLRPPGGADASALRSVSDQPPSAE